jgi:hypothetical protein
LPRSESAGQKKSSYSRATFGACQLPVVRIPGIERERSKGETVNFSRDELVALLVKAGELEVIGGDQSETDSYFDTEHFRFQGPGGFFVR